MKRIKLNKILQGEAIEGMALIDGYYLSPTEKYIINLEEERGYKVYT